MASKSAFGFGVRVRAARLEAIAKLRGEHVSCIEIIDCMSNFSKLLIIQNMYEMNRLWHVAHLYCVTISMSAALE